MGHFVTEHLLEFLGSERVDTDCGKTMARRTKPAAMGTRASVDASTRILPRWPSRVARRFRPWMWTKLQAMRASRIAAIASQTTTA
jgi:hypothetical protein